MRVRSLPAATARCGRGPSGTEPSGWLINQLGSPGFYKLVGINFIRTTLSKMVDTHAALRTLPLLRPVALGIIAGSGYAHYLTVGEVEGSPVLNVQVSCVAFFVESSTGGMGFSETADEQQEIAR